MLEIGIAGQMGAVLAWLSAVLLLASVALAARAGWAARRAQRGRVKVAVILGLQIAVFGGATAHFAAAPQTLEVAADGGWVVRSAYLWPLDAVPADEVRQVRVVSSPAEARQRVEVRRADADRLTLHGDRLTQRLGYHWSACGAWQDRPVWGPHTFDARGPVCGDRPWRAPGRGVRAAR